MPEDDDSICKICLDMVQQARDQLESNMTQEDLKAVFEGSCNLIPLHIVAKQCIHLVDNFIPELVEALSSQMNPQVSCCKILLMYSKVFEFNFTIKLNSYNDIYICSRHLRNICIMYLKFINMVSNSRRSVLLLVYATTRPLTKCLKTLSPKPT